jgi:hypothetical protein
MIIFGLNSSMVYFGQGMCAGFGGPVTSARSCCQGAVWLPSSDAILNAVQCPEGIAERSRQGASQVVQEASGWQLMGTFRH